MNNSDRHYPENKDPRDLGYEDEIDLMELIKAVWKKKIMIMTGVFIITAGAAGFSFFMDKVYKVETIIAPGIADINAEGKKVFSETPENIKALIDSGAFNTAIAENYNKSVPQEKNLSPDGLSFNVQTGKNTETIIISKNTKIKNSGEKLLAELNARLKENYLETTNLYKKRAESELLGKVQEISDLNTKISDLKTDIESIKNDVSSELKEIDSELAILEANEKSYQVKMAKIRDYIGDQKNEITSVRKNTDGLIKQRDNLIENDSVEKDSLSLMIYLNVIQQNLSLMNSIGQTMTDNYKALNDLEIEKSEISKRIESLKSKKVQKQESIKIQIKRKNNQINNINQQITGAKKSSKEQLAAKMDMVSNIKIIQKPRASENPVKPNKKLIVALSFFASFFFMIFFALFYDYIKNNWDKE